MGSHQSRHLARVCPRRSRAGERGQTILLVAASMVALMGMAALAIDVSSLYLAKSEAEKAASAAALAGAKAFVSTGYTSGGLGDPGTVQSLVCNGSTGYADLQAIAAANRNKIGGAAPTTVTTSCAFPTPRNPRITVTVQRTGLPSFFQPLCRNSSMSRMQACACVAEASRISGTRIAHSSIA